MEIDFGQNVSEGVIRQSEQQIVFAVHLPLEIEANIGQGFPWDRQDLGVSQVYDIDPGSDAVVGIVGILQG